MEIKTKTEFRATLAAVKGGKLAATDALVSFAVVQVAKDSNLDPLIQISKLAPKAKPAWLKATIEKLAIDLPCVIWDRQGIRFTEGSKPADRQVFCGEKVDIETFAVPEGYTKAEPAEKKKGYNFTPAIVKAILDGVTVSDKTVELPAEDLQSVADALDKVCDILRLSAMVGSEPTRAEVNGEQIMQHSLTGGIAQPDAIAA